jgi:hypothetical protein
LYCTVPYLSYASSHTKTLTTQLFYFNRLTREKNPLPALLQAALLRPPGGESVAAVGGNAQMSITVLNVAEKPSVAKEISAILAGRGQHPHRVRPSTPSHSEFRSLGHRICHFICVLVLLDGPNRQSTVTELCDANVGFSLFREPHTTVWPWTSFY